MNLRKKKFLASKVLNAGLERITFNKERLSDIKEALTKQDIRDLYTDGAIIIKEEKGRRTIEKRNTRRRAGSIRKRQNLKKRGYIIITRKLRKHVAEARKKSQISEEQYIRLRKEIRARYIKDSTHMREHIKKIKEEIK